VMPDDDTVSPVRLPSTHPRAVCAPAVSWIGGGGPGGGPNESPLISRP
jgi:hypothetical protein